jgi:hypothetical protein
MTNLVVRCLAIIAMSFLVTAAALKNPVISGKNQNREPSPGKTALQEVPLLSDEEIVEARRLLDSRRFSLRHTDHFRSSSPAKFSYRSISFLHSVFLM